MATGGARKRFRDVTDISTSALSKKSKTLTFRWTGGAEYKEARKLLDGVPLVDAARFYSRHHGRGVTRKSVAAGVDAMIAIKTAKGVSQVYLADLRYRLGVFKEAFHCDVSALAPDDVAGFFERLRLSPRSYNNFLRTVRTFLDVRSEAGLVVQRSRLARTPGKAQRETGAG